jgi:hypothetical protein
LLAYLQQFTRDGRSSVFLASGLPASGDGWTDTRSGCVGDWRGVGRHQYDLTLHCLWSDQDYAKVPDRIRGGDFPLLMSGTRLDIVPYRP